VQTQEGHQEASSALLPGLRAGSSQAWAVLYDRLAPGLHRFAVSCLSGDGETAEDIVVETIACAAQGIARFDPQRSSLAAWVYGIARHLVQAESRRRQRREAVPAWAQVSFEDLPDIGVDDDIAARTAVRLDAQRRLREAAGLLSESERELLALVDVQELPGREIGRVVGRSEQATRVSLHRARQKVRRTEIEGRLLVVGTQYAEGKPRVVGALGDFRPYGRWFSGGEDWHAGYLPSHGPEFSSTSDEMVYASRMEGGFFRQPPMWSHVWKAKPDWSEAVNLSEPLGLHGVNWAPRWSPDGTLIAFVHWDTPGGEWYGPGEPWLMRADGSAACRVVPRECLPLLGLVTGVRWSRDGRCLICCSYVASAASASVEVEVWGRQLRVLPPQPTPGTWSPDGSKKAFDRTVRGKAAGQPGHWRQMLVARADGSAARVVVEQFIPDAAIEPFRPTAEDRRRAPMYDDRLNVLSIAGPVGPTWSPRGDKIAFLAALPYDPPGPYYMFQADAWVYDLVTRRLTKVTNEPHHQCFLSWR
jgi:RNA polymerase sigma-70 factor (ECF subfamily)